MWVGEVSWEALFQAVTQGPKFLPSEPERVTVPSTSSRHWEGYQGVVRSGLEMARIHALLT